MATIIVDCGTVVPGESALTATAGGVEVTYTDKMDAIAIHDNVTGAYGASRGLASEIQLVRYRDRASPKLAEKCAAGQGIGNVAILIFKNDEGPKLLMTLDLTAVYVSRIEFGTMDAKGIGFRRHSGDSNLAAARLSQGAIDDGATSVNDIRWYSRERARPKPLIRDTPGIPTDVEVERVWLNYSTVKWTSADGNIAGSFNNNTGKALAA